MYIIIVYISAFCIKRECIKTPITVDVVHTPQTSSS